MLVLTLQPISQQLMGAKLNFDNIQLLKGSNKIILLGFSIILVPLLRNVPSGFAIKSLIHLIAHNTIMKPIADLDTQLVRLQIHILDFGAHLSKRIHDALLNGNPRTLDEA